MSKKTIKSVSIVFTSVIILSFFNNSGFLNGLIALLIGSLFIIAIRVGIVSILKAQRNTSSRNTSSKGANFKKVNEIDITDISLYTNKNVYTEPKETHEEYLGREGEERITREIRKLGIGRKIIRNIVIGSNEKTTEVDVVLVTEVGLFVIESKNYSGWIFGDLLSQYWTQTLPNRKKYKFYNPVLQNKAHINALRHLLRDYPRISYISVIAFSDRALLKEVPKSTHDVLILNESEIFDLVESSIKYHKMLGKETIMTFDEVTKIGQFLSFYNYESYSKRKMHVDSVNNKKNTHKN